MMSVTGRRPPGNPYGTSFMLLEIAHGGVDDAD
jgi:hypothetical protein